MPFQIQRVPRGLNELLSIFGGGTPHELEDRVRVSLEALQFYGAMQRRVVSNADAAMAEGSQVVVIPSTTNWFVLFGATAQCTKTATMTALSLALTVALNNQSTQEFGLAFTEFQRFGATETGLVDVTHVCPYPLVLPPNTAISARLRILGTDATASTSITAHVGVL